MHGEDRQSKANVILHSLAKGEVIDHQVIVTDGRNLARIKCEMGKEFGQNKGPLVVLHAGIIVIIITHARLYQ